MDAMTPLGSLIQTRRSDLKLTLADLSEQTGLLVQTINAIERGASKRPRFETLYALAKPLGLTMEELAAVAYIEPALV